MLLKVLKKVHLFQDKVLDRLQIRQRYLFKSVHVCVHFYFCSVVYIYLDINGNKYIVIMKGNNLLILLTGHRRGHISYIYKL